jgi:hypothetical protein
MGISFDDGCSYMVQVADVASEKEYNGSDKYPNTISDGAYFLD